MGKSAELNLLLQNDLEELVRLASAIDGFAEENGVTEKDRFELQLCLEEIFTNIVSYGFDDVDEHEIRVDFRMDAETRVLGVSIVDDGIKFDPLNDSTAPVLDALLEDRPIGGLGIHLVRKYVDAMEYDHRDGLNHLSLTKTLSSRDSRD